MKVHWPTLLGVMLAIVATAAGQDRGDSEASREAVNRAFVQGPKVGDALPDVQLFDAKGKPFGLGQLKDQYTVLVFGCLT